MLHKQRFSLGWGLSIALTLLALQCSWAQTQKLDTTLNYNQAQKRIRIGIPVDGWYLVKASGAIGGPSSDRALRGGYGARVGGYFLFKKGDSLDILPGQSGKMGMNVEGGTIGDDWVSGGGGGGASWVFKKATTDILLIVAGGGGGAGHDEGVDITGAIKRNAKSNAGDSVYRGIHGQITLNGAAGGVPSGTIDYTDKKGVGGVGGGGGGGGGWDHNGAGGAGVSGDGGTHCKGQCKNDFSNLLSWGGQAFNSGASGGASTNPGGDGGYGGGGEGGPGHNALIGGTHGGGGGGGGYSGGGGGIGFGINEYNSQDWNSWSGGGGGGGSYVHPSANRNGWLDSAGANPGDGSVRIQGPMQDSDSDGVIDPSDNCPGFRNPDQKDENRDGIGDACQAGLSVYLYQGPSFRWDTIRQTGVYKLEARGAAGGATSDGSWGGGKGAYLSGYAYLVNGTILKIGVGEAGQIGQAMTDATGGGGGGASSIVIDFGDGVPADALMIAGGGGGGYKYYRGGDGRVDDINNDLGGGGDGGRTWESDRYNYYPGGGGGGLNGDGGSVVKYPAEGGKSYRNGFKGGYDTSQVGGRGGWGGGGQGQKYVQGISYCLPCGAGGGGGHTGGDAGGPSLNTGGNVSAQGGKSYMKKDIKIQSTSPYTAINIPANGMVSIRGPLNDSDLDQIPDELDNCPHTVNTDQADKDRDGAGDVCDDCKVDYWKTAPGDCDCHTSDVDADANGIKDAKEGKFHVYKGQRQRYTVPKTGWYSIEANGAQGGRGHPQSYGGYGASMQGYFILDAGDRLQVVVGEAGEDGEVSEGWQYKRLGGWELFECNFIEAVLCDPIGLDIPIPVPTEIVKTGLPHGLWSGGGGGGASTVIRTMKDTVASYKILIVAGGGGGGRGSKIDGSGQDALGVMNGTTEVGWRLQTNPGSYATVGGNSGSAGITPDSIWAGTGGGGIAGAAEGVDTIVTNPDMTVHSKGGSQIGIGGSSHGGYSGYPGGDGGFGGGGEGGTWDPAGEHSPGGGGGGGYSGGMGGGRFLNSTAGYLTAYGGGSYSSSLHRDMSKQLNSGDGSVKIIARIKDTTVRSSTPFIWKRDGKTYDSSGVYMYNDTVTFNTYYLHLTMLQGATGGSLGGSESLFKAVPNPNQGLFHVWVPLLHKESQLEVFSPDGRLVEIRKLAPANKTRLQLDLRRYGTGMYVLRLMHDGLTETIKVLVQ